jgi:Cu2+-containing amine oxidase
VIAGEIHYFDFDSVNTAGEIESIPNAVRARGDDSILWKHTGHLQVEVRRRSPPGRQIYMVYWILQDGSSRSSRRSVGDDAVGVCRGSLPAPNHQHFSVRG